MAVARITTPTTFGSNNSITSSSTLVSGVSTSVVNAGETIVAILAMDPTAGTVTAATQTGSTGTFTVVVQGESVVGSGASGIRVVMATMQCTASGTVGITWTLPGPTVAKCTQLYGFTGCATNAPVGAFPSSITPSTVGDPSVTITPNTASGAIIIGYGQEGPAADPTSITCSVDGNWASTSWSGKTGTTTGGTTDTNVMSIGAVELNPTPGVAHTITLTHANSANSTLPALYLQPAISQVTRTRTSAWNVAGVPLVSVTSTHASAWNVRQQVTDTQPTAWNIFVTSSGGTGGTGGLSSGFGGGFTSGFLSSSVSVVAAVTTAWSILPAPSTTPTPTPAPDPGPIVTPGPSPLPAVGGARIGIRTWWTGADGTVWDLTGQSGGLFLTQGVRGLSMPPVDRYTSTSPAIAGSRWRGMRPAEREVFWPLYLYADGTSQAWVDFDRRFWATMRPDAPGAWAVQQPSGEIRYLVCRYSDDGDQSYEMDPAKVGWTIYGLTLVAEQPFWVGQAITRTFVPGGATSTFFGAGAPPFTITGGSTISSATMDNPGDVDAFPVWTINGPTTSVTVGVNGRNIEVPFAVASGKTLTIDTNPSQQIAYDSDGLDRTAELGAVDFAPIPPGTAVVLSLSMVGTGSVTASLNPLYWRAW